MSGQKGLNLAGKRGGKSLGRAEGGKIIIRVHCVKKKPVFNKKPVMYDKNMQI